MNTRIDFLLKGCVKEFMWIEYLKDKRICGRMESLKHSEHILLCPDCSSRLSELLEAYKEEIKYWISHKHYYAFSENCDICLRLKFLRSEINKGDKK